MKGWQVCYSTQKEDGSIENCAMIVNADTISEALTKAEETLEDMFHAGNAEGVSRYAIWDVGIIAGEFRRRFFDE